VRPTGFVDFPRWSKDQLEDARKVSETELITSRDTEGPAQYMALYSEQRHLIDAALLATDDLCEIDAQALIDHRDLWQTLRYCCAPPISEEDLWTVVGRKFKRVPPAAASDTARALARRLDAIRFPWVGERRPPTADERERAAMATAILLTATKLSTARRGSASTAQEAAVALVLNEAGYTLDTGRAEIQFPDDLARETYASERKVGGAKCDVPVRLKDGRLLAIECKVSNGPKNGWKRLQREIGGKADTWRSRFGSQVITCAVVGGSFDLSCLAGAQNDYGIFIVFDHDLTRLRRFVEDVGGNTA